MGASSSFRALAAFVAACERAGMAVRGVEPREGESVVTEGSVAATVDAALPLGDALSPVSASLQGDGSLAVELTTESLVPESVPGDAVSVDGASVSEDTVELSLAVEIPRENARLSRPPASAGTGDSGHVERTDGPDGDDPAAPGDRPSRDPTVPVFEDVPYLRDVYEACDTFAEMSARLDADVAPETTRRYMIDAGIHSPDSYETADGAESGTGDSDAGSTDGDGSERDAGGAEDPAADESRPTPTGGGSATGEPAEPPEAGREVTTADGEGAGPDLGLGGLDGDEVVVTDGVGFPPGTTVEDLVGVVQRSNTVYEVGRELGVDRDRAQYLLRELDLLDLVLGRLAAESREVTREDVVERLEPHGG